jgi:transcriptional regulator with GAF, ATPase, and Fis domain
MLPENIHNTLDTALEETRTRLSEVIQMAMTEALREMLNQFMAFRRLLLYFNSEPDWDATLQLILDTIRADAIQVVCLEGLENLSHHNLPADHPIDDELSELLHERLTIDDVSAQGMVRLGVLLAVNDDLLGALMVTRGNGERFSEYERLLLSNFADELAITLYNIELHHLLEDQADRLASTIQQLRSGKDGA